MPATNIANALKQFLEAPAQALGVSAYRDTAPDDEQKPFVTIIEGIADTPDGLADGGADSTTTEMVQVDVWEAWKDDDGNVIESDLAARITRAIQGAKIETAPMRVYGVLVVNRRRLLEPRANTVHHAITANLRRDL